MALIENIIELLYAVCDVGFPLKLDLSLHNQGVLESQTVELMYRTERQTTPSVYEPPLEVLMSTPSPDGSSLSYSVRKIYYTFVCLYVVCVCMYISLCYSVCYVCLCVLVCITVCIYVCVSLCYSVCFVYLCLCVTLFIHMMILSNVRYNYYHVYTITVCVVESIADILYA